MKKTSLGLLLLAAFSANAQKYARVDSLLSEKDSLAVQQQLQKLATGNEEDLGTILRYYIAKKDAVKRDSLLNAIVERYPLGSHAASVNMTKIVKATGAAQKEAMYAVYREQFPNSNFNRIRFSLAKAYVEERQTEKALAYMDQITGPTVRPDGVRELAEMIMKYDDKSAETLLKKEIEVTGDFYQHPDTTMIVEKRNAIRLGYYELMKVYGQLLMQRKDYAAALTYTGPAYDSIGRYDGELQHDYPILLSRNGRYEEAFGLLDNMVRAGKGDAEINKALVTTFEKLHPGKNGAAYLKTATAGLKEEMEEKVAKMQVNEAAPSFELVDVNGKKVRLSDFKGKTIVLDFWATWCVPCKRSFPAMQMAVKRYSNNANVKFLFIHTWEHSEKAQQEAVQYLKEHKFNFDLYMDLKNSKTKMNPAVTMFGVKGIPAKFVIDGKGNIRFKMTGFSGGDDMAADELTTMIELASKDYK